MSNKKDNTSILPEQERVLDFITTENLVLAMREGTPNRELTPMRDGKPLSKEDMDEDVKRRNQIRCALRREESLKRKQRVAEEKTQREQHLKELEEKDRLEKTRQEAAKERRQREIREDSRRERDMRRRVLTGECTMEDLVYEMTEGRELTIEEKEEKLAELQHSLWSDFDAVNLDDESVKAENNDKSSEVQTQV